VVWDHIKEISEAGAWKNVFIEKGQFADVIDPYLKKRHSELDNVNK
jgi:hypothetical protein